MGAFALVLIPSWVAFALALRLDQPFGPMLVVVLIAVVAVMGLPKLGRASSTSAG